MTIHPKMLFGLTPLMLDSHRLRIEMGVAAVSGPSPDCVVDVPTNSVLDITSVGPWGVDRALWTGWAYLWGLADSTGVLPGACILSPSPLGGGLNIPAGYDRIRYLPYAVYIVGSSAGMRLQLVTAWPFPCAVIYQDQNTAHEILVPSTAGAWVDVSMSDFVPTDARLVYLTIQSEILYGAGGNVWVRTPGCGDGGLAVLPNQQASRFIAMSSDERIQVRTATAAQARLRILGFETLSTY